MFTLRMPCPEHDAEHEIEFEFIAPEPSTGSRGGVNWYVSVLAPCMCNAPSDDEVKQAIDEWAIEHGY